MRSPRGYCNVCPNRAKRWVRRTEPEWPKRCPAHEQVPETMVENIGWHLREVYFDAIRNKDRLDARFLKFHDAYKG